MTTLQEQAEGLALWATEGANVSEVTEVLIPLKRDAFSWHIAQFVLPRDQIERIEHMAAHFAANGYAPS